MELTQLRYFAAVAELQHVTRAAERMHVAQPAITKSIQRLEPVRELVSLQRRCSNNLN
ncbi:LysR family transcriptional regulator, partial [Holdemania massiliensis]|uniref:LysR family transcriptional regulator n=1 Tax=Holdemania massiliensis TaxID=1468449 RepID=UPI003C6CDC18